MDQLQLVNETECVQNLLGDLLESRHIKVHLLLDFSVVLAILIQVVSEKFCHDEQVLLVVEKVDDLEQVFVVQIFTICLDIPQQLNLVNRLVKVVLIILDDLHADHLFRVNIVALNRFRKGRTSQILDNLISARHN